MKKTNSFTFEGETDVNFLFKKAGQVTIWDYIVFRKLARKRIWQSWIQVQEIWENQSHKIAELLQSWLDLCKYFAAEHKKKYTLEMVI